jgi:shikimate dehydrogenase
LLGRSLGHSLSPAFQNAALRQAQVPLRYETLDIPASLLNATLDELAAQDAAGNVTIPYKGHVFDACDRLMPLARRAGAVNTFWFERGELVGDNTDVEGFETAVRTLLGAAPCGLTVGVLGAGGAAAAVLTAVERWPESFAIVHNRTHARARELCARFSSIARASDTAEIGDCAHLVVNATSVGLRDDDLPMEPAILRPEAVVYDLVYRRGESAWVRAARERGHRAADGLGMLVEQGAIAFERWFGFPPDRDVMWQAVR